MSRDRAFRSALANLGWASLEVIIEGFQSLVDFLHRWHGFAGELEAPVAAEVVADRVAGVQPGTLGDLQREQPVQPVIIPPVQPVQPAQPVLGVPVQRQPVMQQGVPGVPVGRMQRYYAVAVGRVPGVYLSWRDAANQVVGFPGNIHRSFTDAAVAEQFVGMHQPRAAQGAGYLDRFGLPLPSGL